MQNLNNKLVLRKDDYDLLISYVNAGWTKTSTDRKNAEALKAELKKASLVSSSDFPPGVVRLNSVVTIKAADRNEVMQLQIVIPGKANIKEKKISILAPLGTALLGFRKGQKIQWEVPAGIKTFTILDVVNMPAAE
jgi:regulator of nucleoside diphosphate kinase